MSTVTIEQAKAWLRVTHASDDVLIQDLIDGAEDEALQYLDRPSLPKRGDTAVDECASTDSNTDPASDSDDLAPVVRTGILLIVQGNYEGATPADMERLRAAAEVKWHPYRNNLGA